MTCFGGPPWFWPPTVTWEQPLYHLGVIARYQLEPMKGG